MTGSWEDVVALTRWKNIARYMREAGWGWATLEEMRSPTAEELREAAEDRHQQMLADPKTIRISGGGLIVERSQTEDGEEWGIVFDIAASSFSPWGGGV